MEAIITYYLSEAGQLEELRNNKPGYRDRFRGIDVADEQIHNCAIKIDQEGILSATVLTEFDSVPTSKELLAVLEREKEGYSRAPTCILLLVGCISMGLSAI